MAEPQPTLPLDLTAVAATNLVQGEVHTLGELDNRTIAPNYGSYFTKSLVITDAADNPLHPVTDYIALHLMKEASMASNKEVCTVIHFKDHVAAGDVKLTYQAIGGQYSGNVEQVRQLILTAALDERPVTWGEILYLPNQFDPAAHMHHLGDLYGWEGILKLVEELRLAVMRGDEASFNAVFDYMENRFGLAAQDRDLIRQQIADLPNADVGVFGFAKKYNIADPNLKSDDESFATPKLAYDRVAARTHKAQLSVDGEVLQTYSASAYYEVMEINTDQNWVRLRRSYTFLEAGMPVPDIGNLLFLKRTQGTGPSNIHVKVLTQPAVIGLGFGAVYEFRVDRHGRNDWVVGARYQVPALQHYTGFLLTTLYDPAINHIQRWADGRYIVNFKPGYFQPAVAGYLNTERPIIFIPGACYDVNSSTNVGIVSIYRLKDYDSFFTDNYYDNINEGFACLRVEHEANGFFNVKRLTGQFYQD